MSIFIVMSCISLCDSNDDDHIKHRHAKRWSHPHGRALIQLSSPIWWLGQAKSLWRMDREWLLWMTLAVCFVGAHICGNVICSIGLVFLSVSLIVFVHFVFVSLCLSLSKLTRCENTSLIRLSEPPICWMCSAFSQPSKCVCLCEDAQLDRDNWDMSHTDINCHCHCLGQHQESIDGFASLSFACVLSFVFLNFLFAFHFTDHPPFIYQP